MEIFNKRSKSISLNTTEETSMKFDHLPDTLRGKKIKSEKIIPTVCYLKNMLAKLKKVDYKYSSLENWEKASYRHYAIDKLGSELVNASEEETRQLLRKHILKHSFDVLGASPFDIYIVAYVAHHYGIGKETFIRFCLEKGMAGTDNSANAIYTVGKADGIFLEILNKDGTVRDWNFVEDWLNEDLIEE